MKTKSAHQTAGLGKNHAYLGHFRKPRFINQGHNDLPMSDRERRAKVYSDSEPSYDRPLLMPKSQGNIDQGIHVSLPTRTLDRPEFNAERGLDPIKKKRM